jgi:hypothetical protein
MLAPEFAKQTRVLQVCQIGNPAAAQQLQLHAHASSHQHYATMLLLDE